MGQRHAEDFFALKNPTASAGFESANLGTKGIYEDIKQLIQKAIFLLLRKAHGHAYLKLHITKAKITYLHKAQ